MAGDLVEWLAVELLDVHDEHSDENMISKILESLLKEMTTLYIEWWFDLQTVGACAFFAFFC